MGSALPHGGSDKTHGISTADREQFLEVLDVKTTPRRRKSCSQFTTGLSQSKLSTGMYYQRHTSWNDILSGTTGFSKRHTSFRKTPEVGSDITIVFTGESAYNLTSQVNFAAIGVVP